MDKRRDGFTILELLAYISVLAVLGIPLVSVVLAGIRSTSENDVTSKVEERNRIALFRVERELRKGLSGSASVTDGGRTLQFTSAGGFDGTTVIPGFPVGFQFRIAAGEQWNGLDDNRNGVADEGELVWSRGGANILVCGDVDLGASGFAMNADGVTITVASLGSLRGNGTFSLAKTLTVFPRN